MWHPLGRCRLHSNPNSSPFDLCAADLNLQQKNLCSSTSVVSKVTYKLSMIQKASWRSTAFRVRRLSSRRSVLSSPWRAKDFKIVENGFQTPKTLLEVSVTTDWFSNVNTINPAAQCLDCSNSSQWQNALCSADLRLIFFCGETDETIPCLYFFLVCGSTFTFEFVFQWATTVLGHNGEGRVGPERTLPPPASAPRSVPIPQSLRVAWFLNRSTTSTEDVTPGRTTTAAEDETPEGHHSSSKSFHHSTTQEDTSSKIKIATSYTWRTWKRLTSFDNLLQDVSHSSGQGHLDSLLRFKKQQWQLSLPSSQH